MTLGTFARFLTGSREAILDVAANRRALWVAALFVVSAGFAREYDQEDLIAKPWYVLIPFAVSLLTSFLLFLLVLGATNCRPPFLATYRSFLTTYWMTAPLAWLYALPVEQFYSADDSTTANLFLLAVVAIWRVALMVRIVSVLFGTSTAVAVWLVMFFADSLALAVLYFTPIPIINIMGGVQLSKSEQLIQSTAFLVGCLGTVSWLVWFAGIPFIFGNSERTSTPPITRRGTTQTVRWPIWALAALSLAVWAFVLPATQPPQQLRHQVEQHFAKGEIGDALSVMSDHEPGDFPPHWSPPPHLAYRDPKPSLLNVLHVAMDHPVAPWVLERYLNLLEARMANRWIWHDEDPSEELQILEIIEQLPNRGEIVGRNREFFYWFEGDEYDTETHNRVRDLLREAEK